MQQSAIKTILNALPAQSIAHIKTSSGDKICIKDSQCSSSNRIVTNVRPDYLEVVATQQKGGKESCNTMYIDYVDILRIEVTKTDRGD